MTTPKRVGRRTRRQGALASKPGERYWLSKDYGIIEMLGPAWACAWEVDPKHKPLRNARRYRLPADVEIALEGFLAAMKKHGYYVRAVEVHSPSEIDRVDNILLAGRKRRDPDRAP